MRAHEELREEFIGTCRNLILFDVVYENMIADLVSMAREANESKRMPRDFLAGLLDKSIDDVLKLEAFKDFTSVDVQQSFAGWMEELAAHSGCMNFLKSVEEWIRVVHKDKSDTLFVVVSFFFENLYIPMPVLFNQIMESFPRIFFTLISVYFLILNS